VNHILVVCLLFKALRVIPYLALVAEDYMHDSKPCLTVFSGVIGVVVLPTNEDVVVHGQVGRIPYKGRWLAYGNTPAAVRPIVKRAA